LENPDYRLVVTLIITDRRNFPAPLDEFANSINNGDESLQDLQRRLLDFTYTIEGAKIVSANI